MDVSLIDFLEKTVLKYPDHIACQDDKTICTYDELWQNSDKVASMLIPYIEIGKPIPVFMKKSCMALMIIWGIIKAGGCYSIVDPSLPKKRIKNMLNTLQAKCVVTDSFSKKDKLPEEVECIYTTNLLTSVINLETINIRREEIHDKLPVYIMFTSGSTGIPKGVVVSHRSVIDFINQFTHIFSITHEDILGNQAPWDFDVSVKDIFSAAKVGATVQIIAQKYFLFPVELCKLLDEKKVTVLTWAVSALCILSTSGALESAKPKSIKKVIFSGEVMPIKQFAIWRKCYPYGMFVNVYGPTEITCNCTYYIVTKEFTDNEKIPIGRAFPNEKVFLLDENDCLIHNWQYEKEGEICVAGTALALGYYGNIEATQKSFVQNPVNKEYLELIYRTGDLAYYDKTNNLCYVGRRDLQIKYMGHRIELTEIEKRIDSCEGVSRSCCIFIDGNINAVYVGDAIEKDIIRQIKKDLPSYMIPFNFIKVENIALNEHGKMDRKKLIRDVEKGQLC